MTPVNCYYNGHYYFTEVIGQLLFILVFINILGLQVWEDGVNKETYVEKMRNWQSLGNPILDRYLPLFLKNGPRSRIFESLVIEKISY
jgi:hypothetical protein